MSDAAKQDNTDISDEELESLLELCNKEIPLLKEKIEKLEKIENYLNVEDKFKDWLELETTRINERLMKSKLNMEEHTWLTAQAVMLVIVKKAYYSQLTENI